MRSRHGPRYQARRLLNHFSGRRVALEDADAPCDEARALDTMSPHGASRAPHSPILIIEDDQELRDALEETVREGGYRVVAIADARSAMEYLLGGPGACLIII